MSSCLFLVLGKFTFILLVFVFYMNYTYALILERFTITKKIDMLEDMFYYHTLILNRITLIYFTNYWPSNNY